MKVVDKVNRELLVMKSQNTMTLYLLNLSGGRFKTRRRKYFSTQYIVNLWNSLLEEVIETDSMARGIESSFSAV